MHPTTPHDDAPESAYETVQAQDYGSAPPRSYEAIRANGFGADGGPGDEDGEPERNPEGDDPATPGDVPVGVQYGGEPEPS